jgi:hypothetical protein
LVEQVEDAFLAFGGVQLWDLFHIQYFTISFVCFRLLSLYHKIKARKGDCSTVGKKGG